MAGMIMACYVEDGEPVVLDARDRTTWNVGRIGYSNDISFTSRRVSRNHAVIRAIEIKPGDYVWEIKHVGSHPIWRVSFSNQQPQETSLPFDEWTQLMEKTVYRFVEPMAYFTSAFPGRGDEPVDLGHKTAATTDRLKTPMERAIAAVQPQAYEDWQTPVKIRQPAKIPLISAVWRGALKKPSLLIRIIGWGAMVLATAIVVIHLLP